MIQPNQVCFNSLNFIIIARNFYRTAVVDSSESRSIFIWISTGMMNMKKMLLYFSLLCACVSCRTDVIGGSVNETNRVDMTTYEWLLQEETSAVVGQLFEKAGLKDVIESDVTVISPSKYSVNRYLRRRNYVTSVDGSQEIYLTLDETNTDPGSAYDGGNAAGAGFQYSNFLLTTPKIIHVLFKRGENWELNYLDRANLTFDNELCQDV